MNIGPRSNSRNNSMDNRKIYLGILPFVRWFGCLARAEMKSPKEPHDKVEPALKGLVGYVPICA